jgi:hypothetical protein
MRDQSLPLRTASSHLRQLPAGYVVVTSIKRDDGEYVSTAPQPTIREAIVAAEALAKQAGYHLV